MNNGPSNPDQSTFWSAGLLANPIPSLETGPDLMTLAARSPLPLRDWLAVFVHAGSSGRTSSVFCQADEAGTSTPSSGRWESSGIHVAGGSWTLPTSEAPSDAVVSSLSAILETGAVPQRYFLNPVQCGEIMRRANARGKKMPGALRATLEMIASRSPSNPETSADSPEQSPR